MVRPYSATVGPIALATSWPNWPVFAAMSRTGMPDPAIMRENSCTMTLRSWKLISSRVNSPSVPTISVMNLPGSVTRIE